ncbi:CHRD domain-containing protein [Gluconacetobacter takamatsuzukensis]|uniref:CHRD domain-containing protein n=1 Tax=Gluconacetobacter takamatsuzukensis TaxID=1286190 RepID=A0A7W4KDV4_9PROT|nr:CHRD domain-containing protein [Gluconacetobacter takamatsuzukensis]MBB2205152.1 CHRD domain-containing protein [Gluconacetobacter takamatsuzukensis]
MRRSLLFAGLLLAAPLASMAPAGARALQVTGEFAPVAGATGHPTGNVTGTLNEKRNLLTYVIVWHGLSGAVMAAHFHGPADPGQDAGVLAPIKGPYTSPLRGAVILTPDQVGVLRAGRLYVNLHTAARPDGEARAQLQVR